jgi:hypothetical protein
MDRMGLQQGKIVVKYKSFDSPFRVNTYSGTWVDATHFTVSSAYASNMVVGTEVIIIQGQASGASVHVVSVSAPSGGLVTVTTTNESFGFVPSGTFLFNIDSFFRMPTTEDITDGTRNTRLIDIPETTRGEWIQFRVELRGLSGTNGFFLEEVQVGVQPNRAVEVDQSRPEGDFIQNR